MKAFILNKAGEVANLELAEVRRPELGLGEVLIESRAIGINPVDVKGRGNEGVLSWLAGNERPVILGWDVSGVVIEKSVDVYDFEVGDEVFGMVNFNAQPGVQPVGLGKGYAQYVVALANQLAHKPSVVSFEMAAGVPLAALTAWQVLNKAGVKAGTRILIHAASGGVGHFAVQLAKYLGAYVIGTSSSSNRDFVLGLGTDEHIDYKSVRFEEAVSDIDVVLDAVGGDTILRSIKVVKSGGHIVTISTLGISDDLKKEAVNHNIELYHFLTYSDGIGIRKIADLLQSGALRVNLDEVFTFENLPAAHQELEKGHTRGKIVVSLN